MSDLYNICGSMVHFLLTLDRPEDSEYEVACMKLGVGKLEAFPSIWGREYSFTSSSVMMRVQANTSQTGPAALETIKRTLNGWTSNCRSFSRAVSHME